MREISRKGINFFLFKHIFWLSNDRQKQQCFTFLICGLSRRGTTRKSFALGLLGITDETYMYIQHDWDPKQNNTVSPCCPAEERLVGFCLRTTRYHKRNTYIYEFYFFPCKSMFRDFRPIHLKWEIFSNIK